MTRGLKCKFPYFWDTSLWLAVTAINPTDNSRAYLPILRTNKSPHKQEKLKKVALIMGILFLITVAIRIYEVIATS